jgi:hypothetical protein
MSRFYQMSVELSGHDPAKVAQVREAAEGEWPFDDWFDSGENLTASGQANLSGGEGEEEFAERLAAAIWRANGGFCRVSVDATYLENLPYETYELDESDYARLLEGKHAQDTGETKNEDHVDR